MKNAKSTFLSLVVVAGMGVAAAGETYRTDINPALLYYQAFLMAPDWAPTNNDYLFNPDWRGQKLPDRFGELVGHYDRQFRFVRQARHSTVPCDWGVDFSAGPATLLPHLARNKAIAQGARLRAMWDLQNGKPAEAREDLLAALALGRNGSRDGTIISALVQIAIENIVCATVAENFFRFSPETLKDLSEGLDAAPARGTLAACIAAEKASFHDWFVNRILDLQKENPGDDAKVMAGIQACFKNLDEPGDGGAQNLRWNDIARAAGGTSDGVLKLVRDEEPYYQKLADVLAAPPDQYEGAAQELTVGIQKSSNPLLSIALPAVMKARTKELGIQVTLALVRAAVEYKLQGERGLQSVLDPIGGAPFGFQRFRFDGVDRGFQLKSRYAGRGFPEVLIFVEKDGPPFNVNGAKAGKSTTP